MKTLLLLLDFMTTSMMLFIAVCWLWGFDIGFSREVGGNFWADGAYEYVSYSPYVIFSFIFTKLIFLYWWIIKRTNK